MEGYLEDLSGSKPQQVYLQKATTTGARFWAADAVGRVTIEVYGEVWSDWLVAIRTHPSRIEAVQYVNNMSQHKHTTGFVPMPGMTWPNGLDEIQRAMQEGPECVADAVYRKIRRST